MCCRSSTEAMQFLYWNFSLSHLLLPAVDVIWHFFPLHDKQTQIYRKVSQNSPAWLLPILKDSTSALQQWSLFASALCSLTRALEFLFVLNCSTWVDKTAWQAGLSEVLLELLLNKTPFLLGVCKKTTESTSSSQYNLSTYWHTYGQKELFWKSPCLEICLD